MRSTLLAVVAATGPLAAGSPEPPRLDAHGDPLPPGAVQRLGKVRFGVWPDHVALSPDGKSIICLRYGVHGRVFDRRTGRLIDSWTLPTEPCWEVNLSRDGDRAVLIRMPPGWARPVELEVWDLARRRRVCTIRPGDGVQSYSVSLSPDGRLVVASGESRATPAGDFVRLTVWDARTAAAIESLDVSVPPHDSTGGWGRQPTFSADGGSLILAFGRGKHAFHYCLDVSPLSVRWQRTAVADSGGGHVTPDGHLIAGDGKVVSLADGREADIRLPADFRPGAAYRFIQRGATLVYTAAAGKHHELRVWDWKGGKPAEGFAPVPAVEHAWLLGWPDEGTDVLVMDRIWRSYDLRTGRALWPDTLGAGHRRPVTELIFSADGRRLASAGEDNELRLWDVETGRPMGRWTAIEPAPDYDYFAAVGGRQMALSADGRRLAFEVCGPGQPPRLQVIDTETGRTITSHPLNRKPAAGKQVGFGRIGFDAAGGVVFATHGQWDPWRRFDGPFILCRWDYPADRWTDIGPVAVSDPVRAAFAGPRGRLLASGRAFGLSAAADAFELTGAAPGPLAVSADGRLVAGVGVPAGGPPWDMRVGPIEDVRVWDAQTGAAIACLPWEPPARRLPAPPEPSPHIEYGNPVLTTWPRKLALHPSGRWLATGDSHGVRLWDVLTRRVTGSLPVPLTPPIEIEHGSPVTAMCFTPDGKRLATGMLDGTIVFWPVPAVRPNPPPADELDAVWADLVGTEDDKGWRAAWRLMDDPPAAVRLVQQNLGPAERVPAAEVARLLAEADGPDYRRREAATRRLTALIDQVRPAVAGAEQAATASPELKDRLRKVLAAAPGDDRPLSAWAAAQSRAVAVLEHIRTEGARATLRELAGGAPGAWLTREAEAALARLNMRTK